MDMFMCDQFGRLVCDVIAILLIYFISKWAGSIDGGHVVSNRDEVSSFFIQILILDPTFLFSLLIITRFSYYLIAVPLIIMTITSIAICFLIATLTTVTQTIKNPSMLIQVPTHLQLPTILNVLPYKITPGITIQKLQLTEVSLRNLDYTWKLENDEFNIVIPEAVISFYWYYGSDSGIGTFTETHLTVKIRWQPSMDSHNRFKIDVISTKLGSDEKKSKISINLGGGVKETVVVEITNLILNHAKVTFQSGITSAFVAIANSLANALSSDIKLYCPQQKSCIYLNTTLTSKPLTANQTILIQVNGAPYQQGKSSQDFEPSSILFKVQSTDITVQIHKDLGTKILTLINQISPLSQTIDSTQISSVTDLNTQTFSMLFPHMRQYGSPRPVLFIVDVLKTSVEVVKGQSLNIVADCSATIATQKGGDLMSQSPSPYSRPVKANISLAVLPIIRENNLSGRIKKIVMKDIKFDEKDVDEGLIAPNQVLIHLQTLLTWAAQGTNGALNEKVYSLQYVGVKVKPSVSFLTDSISMGIKLQKKDQIEVYDQ